MLEDYFVDHAIFLGLFGIHYEIPFDVFLDALNRLAAMLRKQFVDHGTHAQDFLGMQIDVRGLAAETGKPGLMNKDARIGQSKALFGCATGEQHGGDGGSLSDASGDDFRFHKLHGVAASNSAASEASGNTAFKLATALRI